MEAYKVFYPDWTCRGFQYEVGKSYHCDGKIIPCKNGFHACKQLISCFNYYAFSPRNHVAIVELSGSIKDIDKEKTCASDIKIIKELTWYEVLTLVNIGIGNTGYGNSGNFNSGNFNSGSYNSGKLNSGDRNSGYFNSGSYNSGDYNSGECNLGNRNSGYGNSGYSNSGNFNSGNFNSGSYNSGDRNSGNFNSGNFNSGYFNTCTLKVCMFNKPTNFTFDEIDIPSFLYFSTTRWVSHDTATPEEKEEHKEEIETCGGFLKILDYKTAFQNAWSKASEEKHNAVKKLPNFDADIFYEISGIRV